MPESDGAQADEGDGPDGGDKPNLAHTPNLRPSSSPTPSAPALVINMALPNGKNTSHPPSSANSPNSDTTTNAPLTAKDYAYSPPVPAPQTSPAATTNGTHSRSSSTSQERPSPPATPADRRVAAKEALGGLVLPPHAMGPSGGSGTDTPSSIDSTPVSDSDQWLTSPVNSRPPSRSVSASRGDPNQESAHPQKVDEHRFNMRDLIGATPKLGRKSSVKSNGSSRSSDRAGSSNGRDESGSLQRKYGHCDRVAIGKGATSVVRLVHKWDRNEEKLYAVKEFRKRRKNETEKEYVKKLTAEFCISSTLHHTNVVETVDLVQDESKHWCEVMEYCPGGDLYSAIKKGGMTTQEFECCFKQLLLGLQYLHSQGVAHRDIKPENLFFDAKGRLKIGDYGASTVYRLPWEKAIHMSTGLCGSEPYIAPEQFNNTPYDARLVDIWACGIVYYCLFFRELPWHVAQPTDALYSAYAAACATLPHPPTNGSFTAPISATAQAAACPSTTINNLRPRECRSLIRKMLEPDPRSRIQIDEAVAHSWVASIQECSNGRPANHTHEYARKTAEANLAGGHVGYVH